MKFLRFGEIPQNGKSINFFKMTNTQSEDFAFCMEMGDVEAAYEHVPEDAYEKGLSVFDVDSEGLPALGSICRMISLCARLDDPAYIVTGEKVGEGNDGEPLVTVEKAELVQIEKEKLVSLVLEGLKKNFKNYSYDPSADFGSNQIFNFCTDGKVEYCFNGWSFADPVDGFGVETGIKNS